jgi:hypothetical protein
LSGGETGGDGDGDGDGDPEDSSSSSAAEERLSAPRLRFGRFSPRPATSSSAVVPPRLLRPTEAILVSNFSSDAESESVLLLLLLLLLLGTVVLTARVRVVFRRFVGRRAAALFAAAMRPRRAAGFRAAEGLFARGRSFMSPSVSSSSPPLSSVEAQAPIFRRTGGGSCVSGGGWHEEVSSFFFGHRGRERRPPREEKKKKKEKEEEPQERDFGEKGLRDGYCS